MMSKSQVNKLGERLERRSARVTYCPLVYDRGRGDLVEQIEEFDGDNRREIDVTDDDLNDNPPLSA